MKTEFLQDLLNVSPKVAEYLDLYWSGIPTNIDTKGMYYSQNKYIEKMVNSYLTGMFPKQVLRSYETMLLKKIGHIFGLTEGRKIRNYLMKHNDYPPLYITYFFFALVEKSPITSISIPDDEEIRSLFSIWEAYKLILPSKHYTQNYFNIKRNQKLWSVTMLLSNSVLKKEFRLMQSQGELNYIRKSCTSLRKAYSQNVKSAFPISLERMLYLAFILRIITRRFKMNTLGSSKYAYEYSSKFFELPIYDTLHEFLKKIVASDFISEVKEQKKALHKSKQTPSLISNE